MSTLPEVIAQMDETTARAYFNETFEQVEVFRLMYPSLWNLLAGETRNKYIVCVEVYPKLDRLYGESFLQRLALHAHDVLQWTVDVQTSNSNSA